jgi:hypothetical protein
MGFPLVWDGNDARMLGSGTLKKADGTPFATGAGSNSFATIQPTTGTSPAASSATDTLTLASADGTIVVAGNSGTDTLDFSAREASGTVSGIVSTGAQSLAGLKTFTGGITVKGNVFTLQDNTDATKQAQFVLSSIATGQTRSFTFPNFSSTLACTGGSQTFSSKSLTESNFLVDSSDATKKAAWSLSGATTGTTTTLTFAQTANRAITFPNADGTLLYQDASGYAQITARLGIGITPVAKLHVGSATTSGTVGTGALILGQCNTTNNIGAGAVIINGQSSSLSAVAADCLVGGAQSGITVSTATNSFTLGKNCQIDSGNGHSWVGGEDSRSRSKYCLIFGFAAEADFSSDYAVSLGRSVISSGTGTHTRGDGLGNSVTNAIANSHLMRFSGGWRRVKTSLTAGPREQMVQDTVNTTDATVTTLQSFTTASDTHYVLKAFVGARRTGGASGTAGDGAGYEITAYVKNIGGTVTVNGLTVTPIYEDQAAWDVTVDVSSTAFRLRVTGAASNNITWTTNTTLSIISA